MRISWYPWKFLIRSWHGPPKSGCEVDFGRRGKLTCHRIDELFKPNCPPGGSQDPRRPPRPPRPLPGGFGKSCIFLFFEKNILKPPGEGPGGSPGVLGRSEKPVGLEKLVDSMTSKLTPTTKLSFSPVLRRLGLGQPRAFSQKKCKKPRIMIDSTPEMPFF